MKMAAYKRNVKAACAAIGNPVPRDYTTAMAPRGDFVVYSIHMEVRGRLPADQIEPFL